MQTPFFDAALPNPPFNSTVYTLGGQPFFILTQHQRKRKRKKGREIAGIESK
jgi:hypothetical protein